MFQPVIKALLLLLLACYTKCERRIVGGQPINKTYVVYIVWDLSDEKLNQFRDTNTICGGILITPQLVITSAICMEMFPIQYVIAGYNKYVPGGEGRNQEEIECMEIARKPIIEKCYRSDRKHSLQLSWLYLDISVARLETAYNFNDISFKQKCSYQPTAANYQFRALEPGTNVIAVGWGSNHYHKPENVTGDINEEFLRATATKVIKLEECASKYVELYLGTKFRFCTEGEAAFDIYGTPLRRTNTNSDTINKPLYALDLPDVPGNETIVLTKTLRAFPTRKNGPCQNDHGGPVLTFENGIEIVIGIIAGYLVNKDMECVSPAIHTLLSDHKAFISCIVQKFVK